jgi:hypothetical protein
MTKWKILYIFLAYSRQIPDILTILNKKSVTKKY